MFGGVCQKLNRAMLAPSPSYARDRPAAGRSGADGLRPSVLDRRVPETGPTPSLRRTCAETVPNLRPMRAQPGS